MQQQAWCTDAAGDADDADGEDWADLRLRRLEAVQRAIVCSTASGPWQGPCSWSGKLWLSAESAGFCAARWLLI